MLNLVIGFILGIALSIIIYSLYCLFCDNYYIYHEDEIPRGTKIKQIHLSWTVKERKDEKPKQG